MSTPNGGTSNRYSRASKGSGVTRSPSPCTRARPPTRQKGTSDPRRAATAGSVHPAQRSTAAASAEPPPSPPPTGIRFRQADRRSAAARFERTSDEVPVVARQVVGAHARLGLDDESGSVLVEHELVSQAERGHLCVQLVVAVGAHARHPQGHGQLGRGQHGAHVAASLPHSATPSSSARASGRTPARSNAAGSTTPASERLSILRRCANPARTTVSSRS